MNTATLSGTNSTSSTVRLFKAAATLRIVASSLHVVQLVTRPAPQASGEHHLHHPLHQHLELFVKGVSQPFLVRIPSLSHQSQNDLLDEIAHWLADPTMRWSFDAPARIDAYLEADATDAAYEASGADALAADRTNKEDTHAPA